MARILITGASGYIGGALTARLRADGHHLDIPAWRLPGRPEPAIDADIVIHLAAVGGGSHHRQRPGNNDPALLQAVNVQGMADLLAGLRRPDTRVLFFSSNAVYGTHLPPILADETTPLRPRTPYGESKCADEALLRASPFDYLILRPCAMYGGNPGGQFGNTFLNLACDRALATGALELYGGDQGIDTFYLPDLVDAVSRFCAGEWRTREICNVAGDVVSVREMIQSLAQALGGQGYPCAIRAQDWTPSPGVLLNNGTLKRLLPGWRPTSHDIGLAALVRARAALAAGRSAPDA